MNTPEGIRRIATATKWIGDGLGALVATAAFMLTYNMADSSDRTFLFWAGIILGALLSGTGRLLSWIISGFAAPERGE